MKKRLFGLILALGGAGIWLTKTEPAPSSLEISGPFEFNSQDLAKDGFLFSLASMRTHNHTLCWQKAGR